MTRFRFALASMFLLSGCAASDQEAKVTHKNSRTLLSQSTVSVSYDSIGNPFLPVNGERMAVDLGANPRGGNPTEFLMTQWKDQNGRISVDFDTVTPPLEQP